MVYNTGFVFSYSLYKISLAIRPVFVKFHLLLTKQCQWQWILTRIFGRIWWYPVFYQLQLQKFLSLVSYSASSTFIVHLGFNDEQLSALRTPTRSRFIPFEIIILLFFTETNNHKNVFKFSNNIYRESKLSSIARLEFTISKYQLYLNLTL